MKSLEPPIIVICGPTASGKSMIGVALAREFGGEIISADSRQVYKYLNVGTGKITRHDMHGVRHHGLSFVDPKKQMTVTEFHDYAEARLAGILTRKKIPFIVGGTGQYISALIDRIALPQVPPNLKLRKSLAKKSAEELFRMLKGLDPARAETIDAKNPRRLTRAIEIVTGSGSAVPRAIPHPRQNVLLIGIGHDAKTLRERVIAARQDRLDHGVVREINHLFKQRHIPWKILEEHGIDYRFLAPVARGEKPLEKVLPALDKALWDYAKRQLTWFRKDKRIHWVKNDAEAQKLVAVFLKNSTTPKT